MWEMVELKDHQQQQKESKLQFHSCLMLMGMDVCVFEISQLEGLYIGDLLRRRLWQPQREITESEVTA